VSAEIKDGKLIISAIDDKSGLDTVIVSATDIVGEPNKVIFDTLFVDIKSVSDEIVKKDSLVSVIEIEDKNLDVYDTIKIDVDLIIINKDSVKLKYEVTSTDSIVQVSIDTNGNLEVTRKEGRTGVDTVIITITDMTVQPKKTIKDTLIVTIDNNDPKLESDTLILNNQSEIGMSIFEVITQDPDGDKVSVEQLNYTADFAIVNDSLIVKQLLDKSDKRYVIRLELSDGKVTVEEELIVLITENIKSAFPSVGNLPEGSVWENSELLVASQEQVKVFNLQGKLLMSAKGNSWINLNEFSGIRLVVQHSSGVYTLLGNNSRGDK
jgi:hypothetical protein